ncbi:MAG: hypothetical protein ACE14S_05835 [Candidatus Bathyarchaeia archaeon]
MRKKLLLPAILVLGLALCTVAFGKTAVGVKKGDWIEYQVTTTGSPEEGHDVTWARMEILDVQGTEVSVNVTTKAANGTFDSGIMKLNPAEGRVGVWFIIPADLNTGDAFYDASVGRNVTIEGSQQREIAGATRTVTHASTPERIKSWDKLTGVFVESIDVLPNYTLNAIADKTNLWSPQILGADATLFYALLLSVVFVVVAGALLVAVYRKRKR